MNAHNELGRRPKNVLFSMWNLDQFLLQRFGNSDTNDPFNDLPIIMGTGCDSWPVLTNE